MQFQPSYSSLSPLFFQQFYVVFQFLFHLLPFGVESIWLYQLLRLISSELVYAHFVNLQALSYVQVLEHGALSCERIHEVLIQLWLIHAFSAFALFS